MSECQLEMLELKVCISDDELETLLRICQDAEEEGLIEHISITVVKSCTGGNQ